MKNLIILFTLLHCFQLLPAQDLFSVPEKSAQEKYRHAYSQFVFTAICHISYAKAHGGSAEEVGKHIGDVAKTNWNKEAGFKTYVKGVLNLYDTFRLESDPEIQILDQSPTSISFKWKVNWIGRFLKGPVAGVTLEEFLTVNNGVFSTIGEHLGATYLQTFEDEWLTVTLAEK